jgi:hypothetical protein
VIRTLLLLLRLELSMDDEASFQLSRRPLRAQCEALGLRMDQVRMNYTGRPEVAMRERFIQSGAEMALFDEGKSLHGLLHAMLLPLLYPLGARHWGPEGKYAAGGHCRSFSGVRSYLYLTFFAYPDLLPSNPDLPDKMVKRVATSTGDDIRAGWSKICVWNKDNTWIPHLSHTVSVQQMVRLYEIVTRPRLVRIMEQILRAPSPLFYSSGWPDLTIVNDSLLSLVEVKTTDKLNHSQIRTIGDMKDATELDVSVVQVLKAK